MVSILFSTHYFIIHFELDHREKQLIALYEVQRVIGFDMPLVTIGIRARRGTHVDAESKKMHVLLSRQ